MIVAQPGRREVRQRAEDGYWLVYRFDPALETAMQWEIMRVFRREAEARVFALPRRFVAASAA